jgi:hypothetical protein
MLLCFLNIRDATIAERMKKSMSIPKAEKKLMASLLLKSLIKEAIMEAGIINFVRMAESFPVVFSSKKPSFERMNPHIISRNITNIRHKIVIECSTEKNPFYHFDAM